MEIRLLGVLVCFLLSGFAALLYQTVWMREFAFVFGTSELAVATVLAGYMGGLALGSALAGRWSRRVRRPILVYGLLEGGIALCALGVPFALRGATALNVLLFGGHDAPPASGGLLRALFYLLASGLILLLPTALMGATLPLLARHAVRSEREIGGRIGLLYSINTAGAVAGAVCAAFLLLPALGLRGSVLVGVAVNGLVFLLAAGLQRGAAPPPALATTSARAEGLTLGVSWILPAIAVSGFVSFADEVLWTRLLGHLLGGSVYAFATMLASFLAGIALGSAVAARLATTPARAGRGFAVAELGIALFSLAAFAGLDGLPALARRLGAGWQGSPLANAGLAAAVLLPQTLCIGATFPLAVRILARSPDDAAPASARVYAWNTLGAIAGAVLAGFFVLPALGFAGTLRLGVGLNLGLAALAGALAGSASRPLLVAPTLGLLLLAVLRISEPWGLLRSSPLDATPAAGQVAFFAVGRSASVMLLDSPADPGELLLRTNGLPEASIQRRGGRPGRSGVTDWLGALPSLARPGTRRMLVIGLGGGLVLESIPPEVRHVDVIELEPEVVSANRAVGPERRLDPLLEPRIHLTENDARGALELTDARYDAIVSQPSHPWTSGASPLYTREFFSLVHGRLAPGGVFVQWIGLLFVDEPLLRSLVATLRDVFPHVRVYRPQPDAVLFLASDDPLPVEETARRALAAAPAAFGELGLHAPEDVRAALALDDDGARSFAAGAPPTTDDRNLLEMRSARLARGAALGRAGCDRVLGPYAPAPPPSGLDALLVVRRLLDRGNLDAAARLAAALPDSASRQTARGLVALARGEPGGAALLDEVLRRDPAQREARLALLRLRRNALRDESPALAALAAPVAEPERAVLEAWRLDPSGGAAALAALDPRLARVAVESPYFADATRLRVEWRLAAGDAARGREALALLDRLIPVAGNPSDLVQRARAAAQAGEPAVALSSLAEVSGALAADAGTGSATRQALALLDALPVEGTLAAGRDELRRRIAPGVQRAP